MSTLTSLPAWKALKKHFQAIESLHMRDLFAKDENRAEHFSLEACGIFLDYSKNRITQETLKHLLNLANEVDVNNFKAKMFAGEKLNCTEHQAVLHTALRNQNEAHEINVDQHNIVPDIYTVRKKMRAFIEEVHSGRWRGYTGDTISTVVNIGIGGSDLGPLMATEVLKPCRVSDLNFFFVSNVDGYAINQVLENCSAESTIFIISSKSFTTTETMQNAAAARQWVLQHCKDQQLLNKHFVAVSSNVSAAVNFGIDEKNVFPMWNWVGGRYSLWSAIGLPIALCVGMDQFEEMLSGAYLMDQHFLNEPFERNMPVIMAMLGIWYINFFNCETQAILPYDQRLSYFPAYLQQLDMESNGKSVDRQGQDINYSTGPVIWGSVGTNGQHAYYQLLHQGRRLIPADFIAAKTHPYSISTQHQSLLANCLAQSEALMKGRTHKEALAKLSDKQLSEEERLLLSANYKFNGNIPSNTLLLDALTPHSLGSLIALYEHKVFVQGIIWNINSFDQWGVEYGKLLAGQMLEMLSTKLEENYVNLRQSAQSGNMSSSSCLLVERLIK